MPASPNNEPPSAPDSLISERDRTDIQGFVTSSFGHLPATAYIFARWTEAGAARAWIRHVRPALTTARSWRAQAGAPKAPPAQTLNLALTAAGLRAIGLPSHGLDSFPVEFIEGMSQPMRAADLGDTGESAPATWEFGGDPASIHLLAVLGADSKEALSQILEEFRRDLSTIGRGDVVAEEFGHRLEGDREPFGFRDGIAQTPIRGIGKSGVRAGEFILGYENEYGYYPVSPVVQAGFDPAGILPDSPNPYQPGERDLGRNGTFLVYRKLEQNVAGFWNYLAAESLRLQGRIDPAFVVWLASKMIGRWPGGAPLALSPDGDDPALSHADNFHYAEVDPGGLRCPFGAHIRRANPRDQLLPAGPEQSLNMTARHRILRRGRPYGPPLFDGALLEKSAATSRCLFETLSDDKQKRGLHFLCLNASIKSQFEFVQQAWLNNARAAGNVANPDPMSSCPASEAAPGSMFIPGPDLDLRTSKLPLFVTVRAGAYFFLPGLRTLDYLASEHPGQPR